MAHSPSASESEDLTSESEDYVPQDQDSDSDDSTIVDSSCLESGDEAVKITGKLLYRRSKSKNQTGTEAWQEVYK